MKYTITLDSYADCIMLCVALLKERLAFSLDSDGSSFVIKTDDTGKARIEGLEKYILYQAVWS